MATPHTALKFEVDVPDSGQLELKVPFPAGTRVVVFVMEEARDAFSDLLSAAHSSLDFWNNPCDDEDWNNA